eukprot:Hpha_TRINITY_DN15267_c1_g2::TRINITY_DN15267_c1_g2_i2::g.67861::m.67861
MRARSSRFSARIASASFAASCRACLSSTSICRTVSSAAPSPPRRPELCDAMTAAPDRSARLSAGTDGSVATASATTTSRAARPPAASIACCSVAFEAPSGTSPLLRTPCRTLMLRLSSAACRRAARAPYGRLGLRAASRAASRSSSAVLSISVRTALSCDRARESLPPLFRSADLTACVRASSSIALPAPPSSTRAAPASLPSVSSRPSVSSPISFVSLGAAALAAALASSILPSPPHARSLTSAGSPLEVPTSPRGLFSSELPAESASNALRCSANFSAKPVSPGRSLELPDNAPDGTPLYSATAGETQLYSAALT